MILARVRHGDFRDQPARTRRQAQYQVHLHQHLAATGQNTRAQFSDSAYHGPMEEKRIARRNRVLKAGTIEFGGGGAIDCTIRNLSETGAAIEVVSPLYIPDRFTLFVQTEKSKRPCRVVWREERKIGVTFD